MKREASPGRLIFAVALGLFIVLGLVGILRHEMWRDELEIWLIARDSSSLSGLFENMGVQGHPSLWYLVVFLLTRFTGNPLAMQLLHLAIGTASAALFLRFAPFAPWMRVLFCFGYFSFYEYTIISRNYGLLVLLVFVFCVLFERRQEVYLWLAVVLCLLAHTHICGTIAAAALGLFLVLEAFVSKGRIRYGPPGRLAASSIVFVGGVATALAHVFIQAQRVGASHDYVGTFTLQWIADGLSTVFYAYVPIPDLTDPHLWNTNLLDAFPDPVHIWVGVGLSLLLLCLSVWSLARTPVVLGLFVMGTIPTLTLIFFFWYGYLRQHGQIYLFFVVCCWLAHRVGRGEPPKLQRVFLSVLFVLQAAAGISLYAVDFSRPFSGSRAAAELLQADEYKDAVWLGSADFAAQPITAYVERQIYYPESDRFGTFVYWGKERKPFITPPDMLRRAVEITRQHGRDVLLILNYDPFDRTDQVFSIGPRVRVTRIESFQGAIVLSENYYLFRLQDVPEDGGD